MLIAIVYVMLAINNLMEWLSRPPPFPSRQGDVGPAGHVLYEMQGGPRVNSRRVEGWQ